jgi:hypothetical protein
MVLPSLMTGIFRVELLRAPDFVGSGHWHESTTRNIPELGIWGNKVRQARHVELHPAAFALPERVQGRERQASLHAAAFM